MRQSIGGTWVFTLVITFTLIFAGFLVLSLSYSKAYKLKNEMTSIIEKYEGLTFTDSQNRLGSVGIINQYLTNSNYNAKGNCQIGDYGVDDLAANSSLVEVNDANVNQKFYYCVSYEKDPKCQVLFKITVFYNFNLPIFGQIKKYSVTGKTNEIPNGHIKTEPITCK